MVRSFIEYNGFEYPIIEIEGYKIDKEVEDKNIVYTIADIALWEDALEKDCMNGVESANEIDAMIYYYCYPNFINSNPTEEEVIEYFKSLNL